MAIEILGLLVAGAGASWAWWQLQRRRQGRRGLKELESAFDGDAQVVFTVAGHAMTTRRHFEMRPIHLLYGLLQDETFTETLKTCGGDPDALETKVLADLDALTERDELSAAQLVGVINHSYGAARSNDRKVSVTDLASSIIRTDIAPLLGVDTYELQFLFVHGMRPPTVEMPDRTDVHVILRNDNFTTMEFVVHILRNVFGLSDTDATARTMETHHQGRAVIGRFKLPVARDKVVDARSRAREHGYPLWIGLEDC